MIAEQVVLEQAFNLGRVKSEAVGADGAELLNVVFGRLKQVSRLDDSLQMAVGGELEALLLGPHLDLAQATAQLLAPVPAAQACATLVFH